MVIAMLTLPAGTAGYLARSLAGMMVGGAVLSALFSAGGLAASWALDMPAGAVVVVLAGAVFLAAAALSAAGARRSVGARRSARAAQPGSAVSGSGGEEGPA
jgi:zinc transport system permease protein